jgi:hypothetical protein
LTPGKLEILDGERLAQNILAREIVAALFENNELSSRRS